MRHSELQSRTIVRHSLPALTVAIATILSTGPADAADCIVNAHSTARIGAPERGVVRAIHFDRGDRVRRGDVIASLESSQEESRYALALLRARNDIAVRTAQKRAEVAELRAERLRKLRKDDFASEADYQEALLEVETARLEEEQASFDQEIAATEADDAKAALERKQVRSPFDGVITQRLASEGELYNEQEPIVTLARTDPLHVETFLPAERLPTIRRGTRVPVILESGVTVTGTISVIDPVLDAATGTFGVRLTVGNPDATILVGQQCSVDFGAAAPG